MHKLTKEKHPYKTTDWKDVAQPRSQALGRRREKEPGNLLFAHARNYPLLNTCLGKSGEERVIYTYPSANYLASIGIVECSEEQNNHTTT